MTDQEPLSGAWRMDQIFEEFPSAQRTLMEEYQINRAGGPSRVGYQPDDTLEMVALKHGADVTQVIERIKKTQDIMKGLEITVHETAELMKDEKIHLLDVREPRAFAIASIPGSKIVDQSLAQEIVQCWPKDTSIILVCHHGMRSLDAADYLRRYGFVNVRSLSGGVDAWALEIDPTVSRY